MTTSDEPPDHSRTFEQIDLSGARFRKVRLNGARLRMVDLSAAVLRDVSLVGASIDGAELEGLRIDGVEVAPLIEAELARRDPARALRHATEPDGLRQACAAVERVGSPVHRPRRVLRPVRARPGPRRGPDLRPGRRDAR